MRIKMSLFILLHLLSSFALAQSTKKSPDKERKTREFDENKIIFFNGHLYMFMETDELSWEEARIDCENLGGYMSCIESAEENDFILNLTDNKRIWIGAYSTKEDNKYGHGKWWWVNGKQVEYSKWYRRPGKTAFSFFAMMMENGFWNDSPILPSVWQIEGYVCEWELDIQRIMQCTCPSLRRVLVSKYYQYINYDETEREGRNRIGQVSINGDSIDIEINISGLIEKVMSKKHRRKKNNDND